MLRFQDFAKNSFIRSVVKINGKKFICNSEVVTHTLCCLPL